jgi:Methyltransferase domain
MVVRGCASIGGGRLNFRQGQAEQLPLADETFDLVVSTTSFDHWQDQRAGLAERAGCSYGLVWHSLGVFIVKAVSARQP